MIHEPRPKAMRIDIPEEEDVGHALVHEEPPVPRLAVAMARPYGARNAIVQFRVK
jgi:hypothetical protein